MHSQAQTAVCEGKGIFFFFFQISVSKIIFSLSCNIFLGNPIEADI